MSNEFVARKGLISRGGMSLPYRAVSTTYAAAKDDYLINCTSGTFTITLPTVVSSAGFTLIIKNSGTGIITVDGFSSETIDGQLTRRLARFESLIIEADGTSNWIILNKQTYTIQFSHDWVSNSSVSDSTVYYIGNFMTQDPSITSSPSRRVIAMASGWITDISIMVSVAGTLGTSENSALVLRNVTTATNSTITATLQHNTAAQLLTFTLATPLQITKGDSLEIQWSTPVWGTNPRAVRQVIQANVN